MKTQSQDENAGLLLIELNEVNFDLAKRYAKKSCLPNFQRAFREGIIRTRSESQYHLLEPWIQWVSVHTGLAAEEHKVFRLGDIVSNGNHPQIFEKVEGLGFSVGCISPMNAENRMLKPKYFIPDPWTYTQSDNSFWSKAISKAVAQAVNDNSGNRISVSSLVVIFLGLLRFARFRNYPKYISLALRSRNASWRKALFLDLFIFDIHQKLHKKFKPDFSTLFLNAGAHIQHHYLFNAKNAELLPTQRNPAWYIDNDLDPVREMLVVYDNILGEILNTEDQEYIVTTGLSQIPYDRIKFYYRLKDHHRFLKTIGLKFSRVTPRMTRDFLVEFSSIEDAKNAERRLRSLVIGSSQRSMFEDVDNRGLSLFVTLTYPNEILETDYICLPNNEKLLVRPMVNFVAIKNGMHSGEGFTIISGGLKGTSFKNGSHVKDINSVILQFFKNKRGEN